MKKIIFALIGFALVAGVAGALYVLRPAAQPSQPIQAVPLPATAAPTAALPTVAAGQPAAGMSGVAVYQISQKDSQVRFSIDEVLRGQPFTAVGATDQVAGELSVDFDRATVQLGTVQVNARTLKTDNSFRDRAIANQILATGQYEYITFTPKTIDGLPKQAALGQPVTLKISGDLTIRDVTKEVTFDATVTQVSAERLEGSASAQILRGDYQLTIPSVPQVASVDDDVLLEIVFVALRK